MKAATLALVRQTISAISLACGTSFDANIGARWPTKTISLAAPPMRAITPRWTEANTGLGAAAINAANKAKGEAALAEVGG